MPRTRYQQQEAARKRWRGDNPPKGGRKRPIAYRVIQVTPVDRLPRALYLHPVEGTDANALQRAYRRAKRQADNSNGTVKAVYGS